MHPVIRLAQESDAQQIQKIYAPFVEQTTVSFEIVPPTVGEMSKRITTTLAQFPWLVCSSDTRVLGYAYASTHATRAAYQWSVDVSVYVHPSARRGGIGSALYTVLFDILHRQGYFVAFAGIALPNQASVGLHESMGFVPIGVYPKIGYKLGAWHDVGWWQKDLCPRRFAPTPPVSISQIMALPDWESILTSGLSLMRSTTQSMV